MANTKFDSKSFNPEAFKYLVDRIPNLKTNEIKKSKALAGNADIREVFNAQNGTSYARLAMRGLIDGDAVNYDGQTDIEAREKMANAATSAGMAFANAFLGICHSMAHKLGAFHHLPHGVANALMIEEVIRFNASEAPAKMGTFSQYDHPHTLARYAEIADHLGLGGQNDEEKLENLIKAINELKAKVGIKETIKDYGIDEQNFLERLDDMVEQAFDDQCTGANPRYPLMSEIKQMYLNAYYGKHFTEKAMPTAADLSEKN